MRMHVHERCIEELGYGAGQITFGGQHASMRCWKCLERKTQCRVSGAPMAFQDSDGDSLRFNWHACPGSAS